MIDDIEPISVQLLRSNFKAQCQTREMEDYYIQLVQSRDILAESVFNLQKEIERLAGALLLTEQESNRLRIENDRLNANRKEPVLPELKELC